MFSSQGVHAGLAGADADDLLDIEDKDLAVANFSGGGRFLDGLDHLVNEFVADGGFNLDLG